MNHGDRGEPIQITAANIAAELDTGSPIQRQMAANLRTAIHAGDIIAMRRMLATVQVIEKVTKKRAGLSFF